MPFLPVDFVANQRYYQAKQDRCATLGGAILLAAFCGLISIFFTNTTCEGTHMGTYTNAYALTTLGFLIPLYIVAQTDRLPAWAKYLAWAFGVSYIVMQNVWFILMCDIHRRDDLVCGDKLETVFIVISVGQSVLMLAELFVLVMVGMAAYDAYSQTTAPQDEEMAAKIPLV
jgi:uncharacterized YccA/Bax inhibitor family protein